MTKVPAFQGDLNKNSGFVFEAPFKADVLCLLKKRSPARILFYWHSPLTEVALLFQVKRPLSAENAGAVMLEIVSPPTIP